MAKGIAAFGKTSKGSKGYASDVVTKKRGRPKKPMGALLGTF